MAKNRMVNTKFWDDQYIATLNPSEKLLFLFLLTSPLANISGVYEISVRRIAFDTGLSKAEIESTLKKFQEDERIVYQAPWIAIRHFIRHQSLNPKVLKGIAVALESSPAEIVAQLELPMRVRLMMGRGSLVPVKRDRGGAKRISELIKR